MKQAMNKDSADPIQIPLLSLADMCRELAEIKGNKIIDHEGKYITYANPGMFYGRNFILHADESEIGPIIEEIRDNLPNGMPAGINYTAEKMPKNMESVLKEKGFTKFITQIGMIFDLDHGFPDIRDENIREIGRERLLDWCAADSEGFPKPREDDTFSGLVKSERLITYGYMHGDEITSTGMLMIHPELAGIHEISTLPAYRRLGQAKTMICHMLQELQSRGIRSVSLQASDAGRRVYEPLGFQAVSTIPTWVYINPDKT